MIQLLEELSINAWPALQTLLYDGWLLRFAQGHTRRANSINPLYYSRQAVEAKVRVCEQLYRRRNLPVVFKLTPASQPDTLDSTLADLGYLLEAETGVQLLDLGRLPQPAEMPGPEIATTLTEAWLAEFCKLSQAPERHQAPMRQLLTLIVPITGFAVVRREAQVVACGLGVVQGEYAGLFDIVVDRRFRRQGHGRQVVLGLLAWGRRQGARQAYLQVMQNNAPARQLYSKLGFQEKYRYWYRVKV